MFKVYLFMLKICLHMLKYICIYVENMFAFFQSIFAYMLKICLSASLVYTSASGQYCAKRSQIKMLQFPFYIFHKILAYHTYKFLDSEFKLYFEGWSEPGVDSQLEGPNAHRLKCWHLLNKIYSIIDLWQGFSLWCHFRPKDLRISKWSKVIKKVLYT